MRWNHIVGFVATAFVAACWLPFEVCGCAPPPVTAALAIGTVTFADGSPVPGAAVLGETWHPPCDAVPGRFLFTTDTITDAQGAFRLVVKGTQEGIQCARISARVYSAQNSRIVPMTMRPAGDLMHLDSVHVDLTLP